MVNELAVINALRDTLVENVNTYLDSDLTRLTEDNIIIEFPTIELMPSDVTVFIQPNFAEFETLATTNDRSQFKISVFLMVKRDTQSNLTMKLFSYFNGVYEAIRKNLSLGETVDFTSISDADFYPAVEANSNVKGVEISVNVEYTKDF